MKHTRHHPILAIALLLAFPTLVVAADAREEILPDNAGVAIEPAHRAHVISSTNRNFQIDTSKIVWVVTEPAKRRVLLPAEARELALEQAQELAQERANGDVGDMSSASSGDGKAGSASHLPDATVYFPFNSTSMIDSAPVYALVPAARKASSVRLTGFTDRVGTEQYNLGLSSRRASAVSKVFLGAGLRPEQLHLEGRGSSEPVDPSNDAQNRRVEVRLLKGARE